MHGKGAVSANRLFLDPNDIKTLEKLRIRISKLFPNISLAGSPDINGLTPKKLGIVFSGLSPYNGIRFRRLSSTRRKGCDRKAGMSR
jgi:hypothetical protein